MSQQMSSQCSSSSGKKRNKFSGSKSGEKKPIKGRNGQILPSCIQRGEGTARGRESPAAGVMKLHPSLSHDGSWSLTPMCDWTELVLTLIMYACWHSWYSFVIHLLRFYCKRGENKMMRDEFYSNTPSTVVGISEWTFSPLNLWSRFEVCLHFSDYSYAPNCHFIPGEFTSSF